MDNYSSVSLLVTWRPGALGPWNAAVDFSDSGWKRREGVGFLAIAPTWSVCGGFKGHSARYPGLKSGASVGSKNQGF